MIIPPDQQLQMKRFFTPSKKQIFSAINNIQSVQQLQVNKNLNQDESKGRIANFRQIGKQFEEGFHNKSSTRVKLPKIRSMTLNTSYRFLDKNSSSQMAPN